jgi:xanthine dehydrogenase small subunit
MATIAGNFTNASPIGDFTIFFLALDAQLVLSDGSNKRNIALRNFYKGYKSLDKKPEEFIEKIIFELPAENNYFNFEKVSKRTNLDIASVNTAINLQIVENVILTASMAAGGVGPIPAFLSASSNFLIKKKVSAELIYDLILKVQDEVLPISDARGTVQYKRLLLAQLIKAHFVVLFPEMPLQNFLYA